MLTQKRRSRHSPTLDYRPLHNSADHTTHAPRLLHCRNSLYTNDFKNDSAILHWFLLGLIEIEDRQPNTEQFWSLWKLFAEKVRHATWLARIDAEHATGREMMSAIFLGTWWKEEVRHWRSLEGHAEHVHALFEVLPASSTVLDNYVCFLHHVGEQSLPMAFVRVMTRLQRGDPNQMLRKGNTVFLLELLLQRYVYGKPLELKRQKDLQNAVLGLLDLLVEKGSSAAFRMRDDFVTPLPVT